MTPRRARSRKVRSTASRAQRGEAETGILADDPFTSIAEEGIGVLIALAAEKGRRARPELELGLCREHGGDPNSVRFCARAGLDYVSRSPFRVPIARLAAAQAALPGRA